MYFGGIVHVNSTPQTSLAANIAALAEMHAVLELPQAEARARLDTLGQSQPDFAKFLERKAPRLPETQQQALLYLLQRAQASEYAATLQQWSRSSSLSLRIRTLAMQALASMGIGTDTSYHQALQQAEKLFHELQMADPAPLTDSGELQAPWNAMVLNLPMALALDLAGDLAPVQPHSALAVLSTVRPIADARERLALVDRLASIPLPESAAMLQELLADTSDKVAQKAVKKALHRLKAQGISFDEVSPRTRIVGTATHRLEKCLASHIDAIGDRIIWLIRTKPFGGYNIAYVVINYGTGIKHAFGLQASKRELPDLLAKVQEFSSFIELDPAYCQYQLALAQQMNLDTGTPVPEDYFALRDIIGEAPTTFDQAIIYAVLSEEDLREADAYTHHAQDLLDVPEFAGWTLPEAVIQKFGDRLRDLEESQIVVSEAVKRERVSEVYAQATQEALSAASRRIMRLRLEEMAYYLLRTDRRREALWAVAAATSLQEENPERLRHNAFVGALLERSLEYAKEHPSSRIILPFSRPSAPESSRRLIV
jgi:hypothetical protein